MLGDTVAASGHFGMLVTAELVRTGLLALARSQTLKHGAQLWYQTRSL